MITANCVNGCVLEIKGKEIREGVIALSDGILYTEEVIPGIAKSEWRCLANVFGALCVISLTAKETNGQKEPNRI